MGSEGDGHAIQTDGPLQASGVSKPRASRTKILRGAQEPAPGGEPVGSGKRIQCEVETGEQEVPATPSTLSGMPEERHRCSGNGRGPHRSAPRRPEALLGSEQLAGAVQEVPRRKNRTGRFPSGLPLLRLVMKQLIQITFGIQNTPYFHGVVEDNIKNGEVSHVDSVIRMWSFLG